MGPVTQSSGPHSAGLDVGAPMGTCGWALQAKEERLAEEKAKKKAAAKKMEEVEARRKQEEEARRLRWLQQVRAQVGLREEVGGVGTVSAPWGPIGCTPPCGVDPDHLVASRQEGGFPEASRAGMVTRTCLSSSVAAVV